MTAALVPLANSIRHLKRGKRLSSLLGQNGLSGDRAQCVHRLHLVLLALDKSSEEGSPPYGVPTWAVNRRRDNPSTDLIHYRRRINLPGSRNYPYGFDDVCPKNKPFNSPQWACSTSRTFGISNVKCVSTDPGNPDCVGLCGRGCDCWESICGASYKCGYNSVCCAHDLSCSRRRIGNRYNCYANVKPVKDACGR